MPKTLLPNKLLAQLETDFPDIKIVQTEVFYWNPYEKEVGYASGNPLLLLHELAHAQLGHQEYQWDMELLEMEWAAWQLVEDDLAPRYNLDFNKRLMSQKMRTYQDWYLERAKCPDCQAFGFQGSDSKYICRQCGKSWQPNDNRFKRIWRKSSKSSKVPIFCDFSVAEGLLQS